MAAPETWLIRQCEFHSDSVEYLRHIIGPGGIHMDEEKVKVIQDWPEPQKIKDIQSFLGFSNDLSMIILILWSHSLV